MKEELAIRAAKLFPDLFPDAWKHKLSRGICVKCQYDVHSDKPLSDCEVITNLDINWNNAIKLRDEMRNSRIWNDACYEVWKNYTGKAVTQEVFWRDYAIPKHYIEAAYVAKEAENEAV